MRKDAETGRLGDAERLYFVEYGPGSLPPQDMARACGLAMSFTPETCSICTELDRFRQCYKELDRGTHGLVTRVVCEVCLPGHFAKHMREQAALDALVEAVPHEDHALAGAATREGRAA